MAWRLAKSLETLRSQINEKYPNRNKISDGWIMSIWQKIKEKGFTRTPTGCLEYNGYRNKLGYGQYRPGRGKLLRVHRVAYTVLVGHLADSEVVLHLCDNPACSEPAHLKKGTQAENIRDMFSKGRDGKAALTECVNGHPYPADRPKFISKNRCRVCANERNRKYLLRKKEAQCA